MLTLANLSVPDGRKTVVENLQAVLNDGFIYGIYAPAAAALQPLLECISGQRTSYKGLITYNNKGIEGLASYADCQASTAVRRKRFQGRSIAGLATAGTFSAQRAPGYEVWLPGPHAPAGMVDVSKKILLLHRLGMVQTTACRDLLAFLRRDTAPSQKIVIITGQEYAALRDICDYIFLYDKKRFPIVVAKADFALFDEYFEMVFRR